MGASLLSIDRVRTVIVIPNTPTGASEAWQFDCVMSMTETNSGQAYRHPLQNGQEGITDATRLEPPEFQVEGITTDTPVRFLSPRLRSVVGGALDRHPGAVALYEQIKRIRERQIPCTLITSWAGEAGVLTNRWPEVITGSRSAGGGAAINISINFVRFRLVKTRLIPSEVDSDVQLLGSQEVGLTQFVG